MGLTQYKHTLNPDLTHTKRRPNAHITHIQPVSAVCLICVSCDLDLILSRFIHIFEWGGIHMARLNKGIYGPVSGIMGPLIASSWKGQPYLKTRPRKRSKRRGVNEKRNQDKSSQAHYWLRPYWILFASAFATIRQRWKVSTLRNHFV